MSSLSLHSLPVNGSLRLYAHCTPSIQSSFHSSTCTSGPGKSVRTLQVAAHRRDGWAVPNVIGPTPYTTTSPPAILILNTMSCIVIIMYAIVIEPIVIIIIYQLRYCRRTLVVVNVGQLLALKVFHIRPAA